MPKIVPKLLKNFKAIVFDVDKTLLGPDKQIVPRVVTALEQLTKNNVYVCVCTKRNFGSLQDSILAHFPPTNLHVVSNGAELVSSTGEIQWQACIDAKTAQALCNQLFRHNAELSLQQHYTTYVTNNLYRAKSDSTSLEVTRPLAMLTNWEASMITVYNLTLESIEILRSFPDLQLKRRRRSGRMDFYEVTAKDVTRRSGFERWSKATRINSKYVVGIGDSPDDLEFLELVGYSVATAKAHPQVVAQTKRVIGPTWDYSLATYLEEIAKGGPL